jgi:pimeloyl-ACP methyl ester carboxylesterase
VTALALVCTSAKMRVSHHLLQAAETGHRSAIDMMNIWGHGPRAVLGGSHVPGGWMLGAGERVLECAAPGVLHADLAACNEYKDALAAAAKVKVPVTVVVGERDLMTPAKFGRALAAEIPDAHTVTIPRAGLMLMSERPNLPGRRPRPANQPWWRNRRPRTWSEKEKLKRAAVCTAAPAPVATWGCFGDGASGW